MLNEILERLNQLSPDARKEIELAAVQATRHMEFVPNSGPQEMAYFSEADELFYGGQAGGGKSALAVGLAKTAHERSLILRRINKDAKKLAEAELIGRILDGDRTGWNGSDLIYRNGKQVIEFGGCELETDKQRYKGDPHDFLCVGRGTLVMMADGGYRPVESLAEGDMLYTLEGPRLLQRIYPMRRKQCVEAVVTDADGIEVARQIQSSSHAILCPDGWISEGDRGAACEPTLFRGACMRALSLLATCAARPMRHAMRPADQLPAGVRQSPSIRRLSGWARRACGLVSTRGIDSSVCCDRSQALSRPALSFSLQAHELPFGSLMKPFGQDSFAEYGVSGAQPLSLLAGLKGRCSSYLRRCGARTRQFLGLSTAGVGDQECLLLQACAGQPSPKNLQASDQGGTQKHSCSPRTYAHPYTTETRQVDQSNSLHVGALRFTPVGYRDVFDLQVEEVNHYITKGGMVNKNCFDEVTDFLESQYLFITIWNRSTTPGQRCRVVVTGNPPTSATGLWVIKRWGAWLDPKHPNPAKPGELRWYVRGDDDREIEVDGHGPFMVGDREVFAKSRTFIPAGLSDNPDLSADGEYQRVLDMLPKELRDAYRDGRFDASLKDNPWQIIPTSWVVAAQERWTPRAPDGVPMCAMAIDVAQGGDDNNVISTRHDAWFAELEKIPGKMTPLGTDCAGLLVARRRDGAKIVVDCGGGYGGSTYKQLNDNKIDVVAHIGSEGSTLKTADGKLGFKNKRTEVLWKFREALDPARPGGSNVALPPSQTLLGDLTAPTYQVKLGVIVAEPKEDVCARLGRSTDDGDSVVMCWAHGEKLNMAPTDWLSYQQRPAPVLGHEAARSKYSGRQSLSQNVRSRR